jgi:hypothetical protein
MNSQDENDRILAIDRYCNGEIPKEIYTSLGGDKNRKFMQHAYKQQFMLIIG